MLTEQQRSALLDQAIMGMAAQGDRLESRMPTSAVLITGKPVNNVLHLLLSVFCCGLWVPVWLALGALTGERRKTVIVDEWGQVHSNKLPLSTGRIVTIVLAGIAAAIWLVLIVTTMANIGKSSIESLPTTVLLGAV